MPLTIKPPRQPSTTTADDNRNRSRSASPNPPLASPLTPTTRHAAIFPAKQQVIGDTGGSAAYAQPPPAQSANHAPKPELIDRPAARPFSGDDATDAIALRAAISSLQFQRQKAEQHIKTLQSVKGDALARPDDFQQHIIDVAKKQAARPKDFDFTFKGEEGDRMEDSDEEEEKRGRGTGSDPSSFPPIPLPQDVVRCPPINWDKYHIVGEPLDRMHNVQKRAGGNIAGMGRNENVLAAPYDPALDKLEGRKRESMTTNEGRRDSVSFPNQSSDVGAPNRV